MGELDTYFGNRQGLSILPPTIYGHLAWAATYYPRCLLCFNVIHAVLVVCQRCLATLARPLRMYSVQYFHLQSNE